MTLAIILPIVAGGIGAPVSTAMLQAEKIIQVTGLKGTVNIESSNDGGATWCQAASFSGAVEDQKVLVASALMRVNATEGSTNAVQVLAEEGVIQSAVIASPPSVGPGADTDVETFGLPTTINVGNFQGKGSVNIEISGDGSNWSTAFSFRSNGCQTKEIFALFIRANGNNATADISVASENPGAQNLPLPPFDPVDIFIYARLTGSDITGTGTLANPYRTMERAVRDVPNIIPSGIIYRVDVTGIGVETLPEMYEFPVFVGAEGIGDFDFSQKYFHYYNAVNVQADPQTATGVSGLTTIPLAGSVVSTPKPSTNLKRITFAGAGWTPGELKGKFAIGAGLAPEHCVIWENGVDYIDITHTSAPTFPIEIMECSAHIQATKDVGDLHRAAVNMKNTAMALLGMKVSSLSGGDAPFGGWGLQVAGPLTNSLQLCDISGVGLETAEWTRVRNCYLPDSLFMDAPLLLTSSYLDKSILVTPAGPRTTVWGARGIDSLMRRCVIEGCSTMRFRDLFDTHESGSMPLLQLNFCQILNPILDFPPVPNAVAIPFTNVTVGTQTLSGGDFSRLRTGQVFEVVGTAAADGTYTAASNGTAADIVTVEAIPGIDELGVFTATANVVIDDGIYWTGAQLRLFGVDISRDGADPLLGFGAAIRCKGNGALALLRSVTGTGFAIGCAVEDGGNAEQDDAGGVVTDIGSAVGANSFKSGSQDIEATWPIDVYPNVNSNYPDYTAAMAQGTRVWKRS